jgi:hypothetical protein
LKIPPPWFADSYGLVTVRWVLGGIQVDNQPLLVLPFQEGEFPGEESSGLFEEETLGYEYPW